MTFGPLIGHGVGLFSIGAPRFELGPLVPQASQPCGGRSGKVAGNGFSTQFEVFASAQIRFAPRLGFRAFGHRMGTVRPRKRRN
jgi:hypothetical protein